MTMPRFDSSISFGNIISVLTTLAVLAGMWSKMSFTIESNLATTDRHERMLEAHDQRIMDLYRSNATMVSDIEYIKKGIDELKRKP